MTKFMDDWKLTDRFVLTDDWKIKIHEFPCHDFLKNFKYLLKVIWVMYLESFQKVKFGNLQICKSSHPLVLTDP